MLFEMTVRSEVMRPATKQLIDELQERCRACDMFEMRSLLYLNGMFEEAVVSKSSGARSIQCAVSWLDGNRRQPMSEEISSLSQAFTLLKQWCGEAKLLSQTIEARITPGVRNLDETGPGDELHQLVKLVWVDVFDDTISCPLAAQVISSDPFAKLREELTQLQKFSASVWVKKAGLLKEFEITLDQNAKYIHLYLRNSPGVFSGLHYRPSFLETAVNVASCVLSEGELCLDTLIVKTSPHMLESAQSLSPESKLYGHVRSLFAHLTRNDCTSNSVSMQDSRPLLDNFDPETVRATELRIQNEHLEKLLKDDLTNSGVEVWNSRPYAERTQISLSKSNLSTLDLTGIYLNGVDCEGINLKGSCLRQATLDHGKFGKASFVGADLSFSSLLGLRASKADFSGANLQWAKLGRADLHDAVLSNADMHHADLDETNLRGCDLRTCNLSGATFHKAQYNEKTKLPQDFAQWKDLQWKGKTQDPYKRHLKELVSKREHPKNFDEFLEQIQRDFDPSRIEKALTMLKSESVQLFAEQDQLAVTGIIKSQTDEGLLYAARLGFDGIYSCCTQNLKACGGLRGALCKHILVLIIGLVKSGKLDPVLAGKGVINSTIDKPKLDKEAMTEIFLKYKGAESGQIDWRPTETMPEDFYAY